MLYFMGWVKNVYQYTYFSVGHIDSLQLRTDSSAYVFRFMIVEQQTDMEDRSQNRTNLIYSFSPSFITACMCHNIFTLSFFFICILFRFVQSQIIYFDRILFDWLEPWNETQPKLNQDKMKTNLYLEEGGPLVFGHTMEAKRPMLTWEQYFVNYAAEQTEEASEGGVLSDNSLFLPTRLANEKNPTAISGFSW